MHFAPPGSRAIRAASKQRFSNLWGTFLQLVHLINAGAKRLGATANLEKTNARTMTSKRNSIRLCLTVAEELAATTVSWLAQ